MLHVLGSIGTWCLGGRYGIINNGYLLFFFFIIIFLFVGMGYKTGGIRSKMGWMEQHAQYHQGRTSHTYCKWRIRLAVSITSHLLHSTRLRVGLEELGSLAGPEFLSLSPTLLVITPFSLGIGTRPITRYLLLHVSLVFFSFFLFLFNFYHLFFFEASCWKHALRLKC